MKGNRQLSCLMLCLLLWCCEDDRIDLPRVIAFPGEIELTTESPSSQFFLTTELPFQIKWQVVQQPHWLIIEPMAGDILTSPLITVTADIGSLLTGSYRDYISIKTTTGSLQVQVSINVVNSIAIQVTPANVYFDYHENTKTLHIQNNSTQTINWKLIPSVNYITLTPSSGTLNTGQSFNISATINRAVLSPQLYIAQLALTINDQPANTIPVTVNNYAGSNLLLSGPIIDAEYDRVHDKLIAITNDQLLKIDPKARTIESIALPHTASCIGIAPDGETAVAGHNGSITLFDLSPLHMEETYTVTTHVIDVIMAPNNWVYAFPKTDQWQYIRCINLEDGSEVNHSGSMIFAGTKAKLHPSGKFIYGANNGLIPNDAEKYDIQEGRAIFLYDSPYHGDYDFGGELWLADDGTKMITRSKNIFNLTATKATDLIYSGSLPVTGEWVQTADFFSNKNKLGVVLYNYNITTGMEPQNSVNIYQASDYSYVEEKLFPNLMVETGTGIESVPALGQFGFFNSTGTTFYVIVNSGTKGLAQQWAVATIHL